MSNFNFEDEARILSEKVNYFNSKIGKNDYDNALNYLILADWDERKAVQIYQAQFQRPNIIPRQGNNQSNRNAPKQNNRNNPHNNNRNIQPQNNINNSNNNRSGHHQSNRNILPQNSRNNPHQSNNNQRNQEAHRQVQQRANNAEYHIADGVLKENVTHKSRDDAPFKNFVTYLNGKFKFVAKSMESFSKMLKEHAGIIVLLTFDKFDLFKTYIRKIKDDALCSDITSNSVFFPIMKDSVLGGEFVNNFSCISFPSFIFCKFKSQRDIKIIGRMEGAFNNILLVDYLLNSFPDSQSELRSSLRHSLNRSIINNIIVNDNNRNNNINNNNIDNKNKNDNNKDNFLEHNQDYFYGNPEELEKLIANLGNEDNNNPNLNINNPNNQNNQNNNMNNNQNQNNSSNDGINIKDSIEGLSYGDIMAKREREMRELERQQEEKQRKEEEEKKKIKEEEMKKKKLEEDYKKEAEKSKNLLPPEPEENNADACKIVLRYPDGNKAMERRFLKNEKIAVLYLFVKSKGREIFSEEESNDFDLIFGLPPKNLKNSKDKSLEEEGMFPNAIINIKEM